MAETLSCSLATLNLADGCIIDNGHRRQKEAMLQFLVRILHALDPTQGTTASALATLLANGKTNGLGCSNGASLEQIEKNLICNNLGIDCTILDCYSNLELKILELVLVCAIINKLTPF